MTYRFCHVSLQATTVLDQRLRLTLLRENDHLLNCTIHRKDLEKVSFDKRICKFKIFPQKIYR